MASSGQMQQNDRTQPTTSSPSKTAASDGARARRLSAGARSRAATRKRLLESGRFLFSKQGLHGVTTHDIAKRAQVASGTFYLHFKNKRELFREIVQDSVEELVERIDAAAGSLDAVPELVAAQAETMVSFAEENREVIRMLFSADSDAAAVESDVLNQLASSIAEDRRERVEAGRAIAGGLDASVLGQAVVGMWAQVLRWWCEDPARVDRDALRRTLIDIQLAGTHPT